MQLQKILKKPKKQIIGLMSGTSCDGLDIALIRIEGCGAGTRYQLLNSFSRNYSPRQKSYLLSLMDPETSRVTDVSQANFYLAHIWADAISEFLEKYRLKPDEIDLIGSHGQTLYHQPTATGVLDKNICSTLQIGVPSVLAQLTGITTVGDFRVADMALGGQGAPLVPYFDWFSFAQLKKNVLVLNLGGIANFTFVPADGNPARIIAFDTGPGNMLIDQLMQRLYEKPFDKDGRIASCGNFSQRLFDYLAKNDVYPQLPPPKSTGREHYGANFILALLKYAIRWRIREPDVLHTVSYYTAQTVWYAFEKFVDEKIEAVYVGGGGAHNRFVMDNLQIQFKDVPVKRVSDANINEDFKEAICFAVLANECVCGNAAGMPNVTGARVSAILGKICQA